MNYYTKMQIYIQKGMTKMSNWRLYTPEGTTDLLPKQCAEKSMIENSITDVFASYGYQVVETPVMQFYDAYDTPSSKMEQEILYKFFDKEGRIMVLRPDVTTSLARMVATKLPVGPFPLRMQYSGKVFRYVDSYSSVQREFCQSGIELLGVKNDMADCEVILCAMEALLSVGLETFQIEIGQVEFFKGIMEQASLSDEEAENVRRYIDKKDTLALDEYLKTLNLTKPIYDILTKLPSLFGGIEILNEIDESSLREKSRVALTNLRNIYKILAECGYEKYISIDLSLVKGINCYTGMIFKGITHGVGFPICSGGRYDGLTTEFGADIPAVGMAIGTDRLMGVLTRQNLLESTIGSDALVFGSDSAKCFKLLTALRNEGYVAEQYLNDDKYENAVALARKTNIQGIISITEGDNVCVHNLADDTKNYITLDELLSHDDECECGCGHEHTHHH